MSTPSREFSMALVTPRHLLATGCRSRLLLCEAADGSPVLLKATRVGRDDEAAAERVRREINLLGQLGCGLFGGVGGGADGFVAVSHGWLSVRLAKRLPARPHGRPPSPPRPSLRSARPRRTCSCPTTRAAISTTSWNGTAP